MGAAYVRRCVTCEGVCGGVLGWFGGSVGGVWGRRLWGGEAQARRGRSAARRGGGGVYAAAQICVGAVCVCGGTEYIVVGKGNESNPALPWRRSARAR